MPINPYERHFSMPDSQEKESRIRELMKKGRTREEAVKIIEGEIKRANISLKAKKEAEQPRLDISEIAPPPPRSAKPKERPGLGA